MPGEADQPVDLELNLDSNLANAALARREIERMANRAGLEEEEVAAAKTVVTEAFTNAASHAYPAGENGPIDVLALAREQVLTVIVRDFGAGIRPAPLTPQTKGRLGLLMIAALADFCQLRRMPEGGTELTARISAPTAAGSPPAEHAPEVDSGTHTAPSEAEADRAADTRPDSSGGGS
ncbi:MAG: ATP-binding protein [Solirubrobacterales bacterium]|nr:ATP-binding protein [Solirubrobacterales bacterium]